MRRGGNSYYALDVSDRTKPKLAWSIEGGSGDFAQLGQSWSRMIPARIQKDGVLKNRETFEIMDAQSVGLAHNSLVLGKHSGRAALRAAMASS